MYRLCLILSIIFLNASCTSQPYVYGTNGRDINDGDSRVVKKQIIVGAPNQILDASDWIWPGSWIAKLVLWNKNIDSHEVSEQTIDTLRGYLHKNELADVQVLVNTYKPGVQWVRLFKNREVAGPWRFTLGILSAASYTLLPGRFFGGDHYNPYTNTIILYSNDPAIALHEAAHAKDFNTRKYKGLYAFAYAIPGVPLYHEAVATSDALSYYRHNCAYQDEKKSYRTLHPAYGTYVGGTFFRQSGVSILAAMPGHITGNIAAANVDESSYTNCQMSEESLPHDTAVEPDEDSTL